MPISQEELIESQFTEGLTIGWQYGPPVPDAATCLEDARKLAGLFEAEKIVPTFGAFRHIEASGSHGSGQVRLMTTRTAVANNLVAGAIVKVTQSWMRRGVHRNVYCKEDGYDGVPIPFPVG
jgi:hypothetical protein